GIGRAIHRRRSGTARLVDDAGPGRPVGRSEFQPDRRHDLVGRDPAGLRRERDRGAVARRRARIGHQRCGPGLTRGPTRTITMNPALQTSASGMSAQQRLIDVIANNLANVNTTGFKRSRASFEDVLYETLQGETVVNYQSNDTVAPVQIGKG